MEQVLSLSPGLLPGSWSPSSSPGLLVWLPCWSGANLTGYGVRLYDTIFSLVPAKFAKFSHVELDRVESRECFFAFAIYSRHPSFPYIHSSSLPPLLHIQQSTNGVVTIDSCGVEQYEKDGLDFQRAAITSHLPERHFMTMSNPSIEYANPDYGDYTYRKWTLVTIFAVLCGMSSIVVLLRFYTRLVISKYFGRDDWWMLVAWLLGLGNVACWISYLELGSWKHGSDLSLESVKPLFKNLWVLQWIYPIATGVLKLSVLAFYLRVFEGQSKRFRALVYGHVVFVVLSSTIITLILIFQCNPVRDYWDMFNPARNCMNSESLLYAASGIILVTDVSILILPMKHLWRLRIPTQQKVQVVFLVGLGAVTCIASSCRVYYLWVMTESDDRTYDGFEYSYWTAIELWVGIAVTCLPPCKPAFARLFGCGSQARSHYFDNSYITQESYMSGEPSRESRGGYNSAVSSDTRGMHSRSHEEMISFHKSAPLTAEEATEFRS